MIYLRYDIWLTPHDISLRDIVVSLCDHLNKFLKCHFKNTTIAVCRYIICHRHISFIIYHYSNLSYNDKLEFGGYLTGKVGHGGENNGFIMVL